MNALTPERARDDLHRPVGVVAPRADTNPSHPAASGGEQGGVPGEQALFGQRRGVVPGSVEGHVDNAVDVAVRRRQTAGIQAEAACNRRAHPVRGENFAFDLARFHNVFRERAQNGLVAEREPQRLHPAEQFSLSVAGGREGFGKPGYILLEPRPFRLLPDIHGIFSAIIAENIGHNLRSGKFISVKYAEII